MLTQLTSWHIIDIIEPVVTKQLKIGLSFLMSCSVPWIWNVGGSHAIIIWQYNSDHTELFLWRLTVFGCWSSRMKQCVTWNYSRASRSHHNVLKNQKLPLNIGNIYNDESKNTLILLIWYYCFIIFKRNICRTNYKR